MKNALINGLLAALVHIVIFLIFNAVDPKLNFAVLLSALISTVIYLFFIIRAGFQERKKAGGSLGFGEAFLITFGIYGFASFVYMVFVYLVISNSPELMEIAGESAMESMKSGMAMTGLSEAQVALEMEKQDFSDLKNAYTVGSSILGWAGSLIFPGLVYALIASFVVKKNVVES